MNVAVLGFGTVGQGVYEMLHHAEGLRPGKVLVRPGKDDQPFKVTSIEQITEDKETDAVVEVLGGLEPARTYVTAALRAGKHVVTANKALVAAFGLDLAAEARAHHVAFLFSAACGGGVPFLHNLSVAVQTDKVVALGGILNGTTNFMLDFMQRLNRDYGEALHEAQEKGYAEADPTADVSGLDALRKLMLASAVAFKKLPTEGLCCEGIENFRADDAADILAQQRVCRLVASGSEENGRVCAYVEPLLVRDENLESRILSNFNLAYYVGQNCERISLVGAGAGRFPTASAVLRDLTGVMQGVREMMPADCAAVSADCSKQHPYYVRIDAAHADRIPAERKCEDGENVRIVTRPMAVQEMHALAKQLREEGCELFFAGYED